MTGVPPGAASPSASSPPAGHPAASAPSTPAPLLAATGALSRLAAATAIRHRPQMLDEMLAATLDLLDRAAGRLVIDTPAGPLEISSDHPTAQALRHWRYPLHGPGSSGPALGHLVIDDVERREMNDLEEQLAAAVVTVLGSLLAQSRALDAAEQVIAQLSTALTSRVVLEQAKGMLAERHGIDPDAAFDLLRVTARQQRRALQQLARELVTEPRNRSGA